MNKIKTQASKMGPYTKKVVECFNNPKNYGRITDADGVGKVGNPVCGDVMWLYIKVGKNKKGQEIIKDIKFETFGCVAAIATSTILTQMAKGKTLGEARKIDKQEIVKSLGGLPPIKVHCSVLAASALNKAIDDYESKKSKK
jgi:nitrogen fixation protein NifU and related proteins